MGKGDFRRPAQISDVTYAANYARTFQSLPTTTEGQGGVMIDFRKLGFDEPEWNALKSFYAKHNEGPE